jgi:hypothetical protein
MPSRALIIAILAAVGMTTVYANPAFAQCDSTGHGDPGITNVAATSSSITVSWLLQCPLVPTRMELREGGTSQRGWQDGTLLGSTDLAPLMNGGGVTASNLAADTLYPNLRVCSVYTSPDFESWCTSEFGAQTSGSSSGLPDPPKNLKLTFLSWDSAHLDWQNGANATGIVVTSIPATVNANFPPDWTGGQFYGALKPVTSYLFSVCEVNQKGQSCAQISGTTPAPPPAPSPAMTPPASVKAAWSGAGQIAVTWIPGRGNSPQNYLNVYHRIGIAPLTDIDASPWVAVASHLNINANSFTDTRPHIVPRHIYVVCAVDHDNPSYLACSERVAAPP